jgi:hypothetical protein
MPSDRFYKSLDLFLTSSLALAALVYIVDGVLDSRKQRHIDMARLEIALAFVEPLVAASHGNPDELSESEKQRFGSFLSQSVHDDLMHRDSLSSAVDYNIKYRVDYASATLWDIVEGASTHYKEFSQPASWRYFNPDMAVGYVSDVYHLYLEKP